MKKLLSISLCLLLLLPSHAQQKKQEPKVVGQIVCGLVCLGIGLVVVWEIRKTCKRVFEQQDQQATNTPPNEVSWFTGQGTNTAIIIMGKGMCLIDYAVPFVDVTANGWTDSKSGLPVAGMETCVLESSTNMSKWSEEYTVNLWSSDAGVIMLYSKAGLPVLTNYLETGATNFVPLDLGPMQSKKFFRVRGL